MNSVIIEERVHNQRIRRIFLPMGTMGLYGNSRCSLCVCIYLISLIIVVVDSIKNRDYQVANSKKIERDKEYEDLKNGLPTTSEEIPKILVGRDKIYYNNSFETTGNLWRTIVFAVIAITIFSSHLT